jgi:hypothetical protein
LFSSELLWNSNARNRKLVLFGVTVLWKSGTPSDTESLELLRSYVSINEPEQRRRLFELAQRLARETVPPTRTAGDAAKSP